MPGPSTILGFPLCRPLGNSPRSIIPANRRNHPLLAPFMININHIKYDEEPNFITSLWL